MRRRKLVLLALIPALSFGLSACGGVGSSTGNATPQTPQNKKAADLAAMRAFAKCMRENGVNMPDPVDDGMGIRVETKQGAGDSPEEHRAAETKCRHLRPNGGEPPKMNAEQLAKSRKHAKCMREQGIEMPDPDENGRITIRRSAKPGSGDGPSLGGDPNSQKFKDAEKACRHLRPMLGSDQEKGS